MCLVVLLGNIILLIVIPAERSLHQPMYIFLAVLAATDIRLCAAIVPKMVAIFWFRAYSMAFDACLAQLFFIHTLQCMESGILLAMAFFDCYIAICDPLRHTSTLTPSILRCMIVVVVTRAVVTKSYKKDCIFFILFKLPTLIVNTWLQWSLQQMMYKSIKYVVFLWALAFWDLTWLLSLYLMHWFSRLFFIFNRKRHGSKPLTPAQFIFLFF